MTTATTSTTSENQDGGVYRGTVQSAAIIRLVKVGRTYWRGKEKIEVLQDLDLTINEGAFEALMGPSGSGKSTLLNLIAGLDRPTAGTITVGGADLTKMSDGQRATWRSK